MADINNYDMLSDGTLATPYRIEWIRRLYYHCFIMHHEHYDDTSTMSYDLALDALITYKMDLMKYCDEDQKNYVIRWLDEVGITWNKTTQNFD